MLARILAVLSALLLVAAFALAVLLPPELWLGQAISMVDHDWLVNLQDAVRGVSEWSWQWLVLPLLMRPAWLLPAGTGLICAGAAVTLSSRRGPLRTRRRS
jgi:hypothetical protein